MKKWKREGGREEKRKEGEEQGKTGEEEKKGRGRRRERRVREGRDPYAHLVESEFTARKILCESQPLVTANKLFFAFLSSQPTFCAIWIS